eukprot:4899363-Prymnesium_polylepis.2
MAKRLPWVVRADPWVLFAPTNQILLASYRIVPGWRGNGRMTPREGGAASGVLCHFLDPPCSPWTTCSAWGLLGAHPRRLGGANLSGFGQSAQRAGGPTALGRPTLGMP